jgi:hypothetical protein
VALDPPDELVHAGSAAGDAEGGRLDHGERPEDLGVPRRSEQRDDAAVRVADEVGSRLEELLEPHGLVLEIDPFDIRSGREAAPVRRRDLETLRERFLALQVSSALTTEP